jgi:adenine C2-methylase RlmN of 23S rRNA A2503 and tRNA A37
MMREATMRELLEQVSTLVEYVDKVNAEDEFRHGFVRTIHFNFMARGEPMENSVLFSAMQTFVLRAESIVLAYRLPYKIRFNVSSIIPTWVLDKEMYELWGMFHDYRVHLYYSLYSLDPAFRKRWLPRAADPLKALDKIQELQISTRRPVVFHWAYIKGENDSLQMAEQIAAEIIKRQIHGTFNVVRYNPFSEDHGQEADEPILADCLKVISAALGSGKIIPRVGFDVKASCGMFVGGSICT